MIGKSKRIIIIILLCYFYFFSDCIPYLPLNQNSMAYTHKKENGSLSLFKGSSDHLIFVGGPVWSMDWAPNSNPNSKHSYVAMATYRTYNEVDVCTCTYTCMYMYMYIGIFSHSE